MERVFEIRTEPHRAVIGAETLLFEPEAVGAEYVTLYAELQRKQEEVSAKTAPRKASSTKHAKPVVDDLSNLIELEEAMRNFLASFMLAESKLVFHQMRLPQRILIELIEWIGELYGGGSGNPDAASGTSDD